MKKIVQGLKNQKTVNVSARRQLKKQAAKIKRLPSTQSDATTQSPKIISSPLSLIDQLFNERISAQDHEFNAHFLRARCIEKFKPAANLIKGLRSLERGQNEEAYLYLSIALNEGPKTVEYWAPFIRALVKINLSPKLALDALHKALKYFPGNPHLWLTYWDIAQTALEVKILESQTTKRLPFVEDARERDFLLTIIRKIRPDLRFIGAISLSPDAQTLQGWTTDFLQPSQAPILKFETNLNIQLLNANAVDPLTEHKSDHSEKKSQLHGVHLELEPDLRSAALHFEDGTQLYGSPIKISHTECVVSKKSHSPHVDILIPVFDSPSETFACLESVIQARTKNKTKHEIIVLDDASLDLRFSQDLQIFCKKMSLTYHRHMNNLGFTDNINFGLNLHSDRDVILLNSDTRVIGNWVDRLKFSAYSHAKIASVTPLSNNGEMTSFPIIKKSNKFPKINEHVRIDQLISDIHPAMIDIPSGCGFCFFMKRSAIDDVGCFNATIFRRGYEEETDWCFRASQKGWRHVSALNLYVAHQGESSFGAEKNWLVSRNSQIIKERYPCEYQLEKIYVQGGAYKKHYQMIQKARFKDFVQTRSKELHRIHLIESNHPWLEIQDEHIILEYCFAGKKLILSLKAPTQDIECTITYNLLNDEDIFIHDISTFFETRAEVLQLGAAPGRLLKLLKHLKFKFLFSSPPPPPQLNSYHQQIGNVWLIADKIKDEALGESWINFITKAWNERSEIKFILTEDTPWEIELLKLPNVIKSYPSEGFKKVDHARMGGFSIALSLEKSIDNILNSYYRANYLADLYGLPLYAESGSPMIFYGAKELPVIHERVEL